MVGCVLPGFSGTGVASVKAEVFSSCLLQMIWVRCPLLFWGISHFSCFFLIKKKLLAKHSSFL